MKKFFLFTFIVLSAEFASAQINGQCEIYGLIFVTEIPERAQYRVFIEDSEAFANVVVFEEENELMADQEGIWHFTKNPQFAHYLIYFVDRKSESDFTIYYTDIPGFAGCN